MGSDWSAAVYDTWWMWDPSNGAVEKISMSLLQIKAKQRACTLHDHISLNLILFWFTVTWVISKVLHTVCFLFKMNLFYKIHLQTFNIISIVLYHSGPTFGQVLYSCQDAFVVDESDYSGHLIRHLLSASEAFPTEWLLQFWEQVQGWWAHVRTVRRVGKHLPTIIFQNFRYCTWGMRPRVNVWSLATARDLTPVSFFFHFKAPFCRTRTT